MEDTQVVGHGNNMKKKSWLIKICCGLILGLIVVYALEIVRERYACRSRLYCLYDLKVNYLENHDGQFPRDIVTMVASNGTFHSFSADSIHVLISCPGNSKERDNSGGRFQPDYIYMNWIPFFGTNVPKNYPLVYDRKLSNHLNLGVNVLQAGGYVFWDFRAKWLKKFAAEHPEYHLQLPE
jgi:hypothetical protein